MAYKQITSCFGGAPLDVDFGSIPGINNGDILYLTFTNSLIDGCYTVDADAFSFSETVVTTTPSYVDCPTCLAANPPTPTPTPTLTPTPCPCNEFLVTISSTDTNDATGNTGSLSIYNNVVVWTHTDCVTGLSTEELLSSGTFNLCACGFGSSLTYWKNDSQNAASPGSTANVVGPCAASPSPTPSSTQTPTPSSTQTSTPTNPPVWYQIFDCDDSSVAYSIAYTAGAFSLNERCTAVNVLTRTVIIIGSTGTLPGGILYTLTSLGTTGCPSTPVPTDTQTPTPTQTPSQTPTTTLSYVEYGITSFGYATTYDACASLNPTTPVYTTPGNTTPIVGMIFYDDTALTIPHNGGFLGQYYLLERLGTQWAAQVDTVGELTDYAICSSLPTPTPTSTQSPIAFYVTTGTTEIIACSNYTNPTNRFLIYTPPGTVALTNGLTCYIDSSLTIILPNNYFSDGTNSWLVAGGAGTLNNEESCFAVTSTPTATPSTTPNITPSNSPTPNVTPSPTPATGIWTITNFDCGLGSINDVGINGSFMNSLPLGPSTFPLTSTLSGSRAYPSGVINGSNLIQLNVTSPLPGPTGCAIISVYVNSVLTAQAQFDNNPFPQISANLNVGDDVLVLVQCYATPCTTLAPTPTNTQTPTQTPSETPTQTPSLSPGASPNPTTTPTETPTPTNTETTTQTPTNTETPTQTPTNTETQTQTPTPSITESQTQTPTPSITSSQTQTPTPSITASQTETPSPTPNPTSTPTPSITSSPTPTPGFAVQFVDCSNSENIFRFNDPAIPSTTGVTYYITGSTSFDGCATTVVYDGSGPQYDGAGVSFLMTGAGCGDPVCPRSSNKAALLTRCSDGQVFYFNVEEDTAFIGAAYVYSGVCYSFVEFSGPGGDNIGSPLYQNCFDCLAQPTPTPTPYPTPTNTPTVSSTPPACIYSSFCLSSTLSSVINYNGNYNEVGFYNGKPYYVGDGATTGYIYYVTGSTEYWCLSNSLGGTCILQGASPCYSQCPDILANGFTGGICPTPTPTPINCNIFNFNAYFDCDWEPLPTPTPSVACDDVNFDIGSIGVTPTPSPTGIICNGTAVSFSMSGYTPAVTPTIPLTPTVTITRTVDVQGQATFNMLDETFNCVSVKVLTNCNTGKELYTSSNLSYNGITVVTGMTFFALINNENVCVTYTRDDSNFSSNSIVNQIFQIYSNCANCSNVPTPTPSVTTTPTQTPSPTAGLTPTATSTPPVTPTQTKTQTPTPSPTSTLGSTPTQTPSNTPTETPAVTPTQTQTASNTPTPSITKSPTPTPVWVYVYQSCQQIRFGKFTSFAQVIQTQQVSFTVVVGESFKDDQGNCWVYNGRFAADYIAPPTMTPITFQGDYFANAATKVYTSCDDCLTPVTPPQQTVIGVGGSTQPCIGGTIDDFMGAFVNLSGPVTVDTTIGVIVYYQYANSYLPCSSSVLPNNNSTQFGVFIPAGEANGVVDACTEGQYFSTGVIICGACVNDSDNPNINFGSYGC